MKKTMTKPLTKKERKQHEAKARTSCQIYCSTYDKYYEDNLDGMWIDLETFDDADSFLEFCRRLHSDEDEPELMFQDIQGVPEGICHERPSINELNELFEWLRLNDDERAAVSEYLNEIESFVSVKDIVDRLVYSGRSDEYFDIIADDIMDNYNFPDHIRHYFDYAKWEIDCELEHNVTSNHVFCF